METFERLDHALDKGDEDEEWKDLVWFAKELKQEMGFSYDILREDKVNIKKVRTEKLTGTEDEPIRALCGNK